MASEYFLLQKVWMVLLGGGEGNSAPRVRQAHIVKGKGLAHPRQRIVYTHLPDKTLLLGCV